MNPPRSADHRIDQQIDAAARGPESQTMSPTDSIISESETGIDSISNCPASIFERSRMSLMMPSNEKAELADGQNHALLFGIQFAFAQQIDHADHAIPHRRPDLVAHGGQESAFGFVGATGILVRQLQLFLCLHHFGNVEMGHDAAGTGNVRNRAA